MSYFNKLSILNFKFIHLVHKFAIKEIYIRLGCFFFLLLFFFLPETIIDFRWGKYIFEVHLVSLMYSCQPHISRYVKAASLNIYYATMIYGNFMFISYFIKMEVTAIRINIMMLYANMAITALSTTSGQPRVCKFCTMIQCLSTIYRIYIFDSLNTAVIWWYKNSFSHWKIWILILVDIKSSKLIHIDFVNIVINL